MAIFLPLGFKFNVKKEETNTTSKVKNKNLIKDLISLSKKTLKRDKSIEYNFFWVNPERISFTRNARPAISRTITKNIVSFWPNEWDQINFEGICFGIRGVMDINLIERINPINFLREEKEIVLIYKYKEFNGFIKSIRVENKAEDPFIFSYSFEFVSKDAFELYRMMIGNLPFPGIEYNAVLGNLVKVVEYFKNYYFQNFTNSFFATYTANNNLDLFKKSMKDYLNRLSVIGIIFGIDKIRLLGRNFIKK